MAKEEFWMSAAFGGNEQAMIDPTVLHPFLLFAQRYAFYPNESSFERIAYMNAIIIVETGGGILHMDDRDIPMKAGTLVYIPAGKIHRWRAASAEPMIHRTAYFDWNPRQRPFVSEGQFFHIVSHHSAPLSVYVDEEPALRIEPVATIANLALWLSYHNRFLTLPGRIGGTDMREAIRLRGEFQVFLSLFLSTACKDSSNNGDPRIRELLKLVASQAEIEEQELVQYAEQIGLKRSRFYALFREETGLSPKHYMTRRKLQRIKCDLRQSDVSITEIAEKYGYSSIHVLSKNFRKHIGLTPSEYRRQSRM